MINSNKSDTLHVTSKLISICGNKLITCHLNISDDKLRRLSILSDLCWENEHRIADGVVCFTSRNGYIRYCFFNPDGSFEKICGNGLFAVGSLLENFGKIKKIKIFPFDSPGVNFFQIRMVIK